MIARRGIPGESGRSITLHEMQQNSLDGGRNFRAGSKSPVDESDRHRVMVSVVRLAAVDFGTVSHSLCVADLADFEAARQCSNRH